MMSDPIPTESDPKLFEMKCKGSTAAELRQMLKAGRLTFSQREMVLSYLGPKSKAEVAERTQRENAQQKRRAYRAEEAWMLAAAANRKANWALALVLAMAGSYVGIIISSGRF